MTGRRRVALAVGALLVVTAAVGWTLFLAPYEPGPNVPEGYDRCAALCITRTDGRLVVAPPEGPKAGFIFYTAARVPPVAYLEVAAGVAQAGHLVVIPELPLNLAVLDSDAALAVIEDHEDVERWAVGGHSTGGAVAAEVAGTPPVTGLALLATDLGGGGVDLSEADVEALIVYGTDDEVVTAEEAIDGLERLPPGTAVVEIEGGNHGGFGDYGDHPGDGEAAISPLDQTRLTADAIVELLDRMAS